MARKRTQAKRSGTAKRKTTASGGSRRKTKTEASRAKTKTTARRATAKKTTSRSKTKTASRSKTKTASRARTKTAGRSKKAGAARASSRGSRTKRLGSLDDVLMEQLADLRSAETQLVAALPKVARAATHPQLRTAIEDHLEETRQHVRRLDRIFAERGTRAPSMKCKGMEGLLEEADEMVSASGDPASKDAALIAAAQRVEHYEIAAYGTARTLAGELGLDNAKNVLQETLDEEGKADALLTQIATGGLFRTGVNEQATA